ncbi:hypothetical protein SODALDRAFT_323099 [Sodiomyces alkalinus F11]|uniref:Uncharacterized protein n=1 Tax=Sodiomyces alkalinus (strain CBS 110278 / VKM F-3762 / F11) TaxID=1314773 RepID=A0A3N2PZ54_SODAK|nr:hypothetical protein SODALDRAFT_323099 [Sodiomyces alkalinus F11]ROT39762.1 hypothetical protein SODALDRAFT_323099 [Sodiomyces alkalinus F11]
MPANTKPKLPQLTTPVSATFPSEAVLSTAPSTSTPLSAKPMSACSYYPPAAKTPISPPTAYTDFLKSVSAGSLSPSTLTPPNSGSSSSSSSSSASGPATSGESPMASPASSDSEPSTATSDRTDCSCKCDVHHHHQHHHHHHHHRNLKGPATAPVVPPSPFTQSLPMSAPPNGADSFPSLKIPVSPAFSYLDSPRSATPTTARSPFSARSVHSVFDWDAVLKARKKPSRTSVRHVSQVVTRTVTYHATPRMNPAPRGKRRKVEHTPS